MDVQNGLYGVRIEMRDDKRSRPSSSERNTPRPLKQMRVSQTVLIIGSTLKTDVRCSCACCECLFSRASPFAVTRGGPRNGKTLNGILPATFLDRANALRNYQEFPAYSTRLGQSDG
jgi:hypothetical protein